MSSPSTTTSSEARVCLIEPLAERTVATYFLDFAQAAQQGCRFEDDGQREDDDRNPDHRQRLRMLQLVNPLVDREQAAHRKQQDRDDKAPEVAELAIAERMLRIGTALRLCEPEIQ